MTKQRYELVGHTADLAVRVRGRDLEELCANLTWFVADQFTDAATVTTGVAAPLALDAADREALLVMLANELIFRREAHGLLLPVLDAKVLDGKRLRGLLRGAWASPERHTFRSGLKAATWHALRVTDLPDGSLEAFVVFDI